MLFFGKICVPEARVGDVILEHHQAAGHCGVKRLVKEMGRRCILPRSIKVFEEVHLFLDLLVFEEVLLFLCLIPELDNQSDIKE